MTTRLKDFASSTVAAVEPETSALLVSRLMRKHHIGAIVVVEAGGSDRPVGIVTDRDLVLELMSEGLDPEVFTAGDIMSVDLVLASPEMDALEAIELMKRHRLRRLVIADANGSLAGIVTMEDVLMLLTHELADLTAGVASARDREVTERA